MNEQEETGVYAPPPQFTTVQAGRGVAAIAVLLFHTSAIMSLPKYGEQLPFGNWMGSGDLGVDFFFVLSGFIIFSAHKRDIGRPKMLPRYVHRRVTRIYPIYWVYLTAILMLTAIGVGESHFHPTPTNVITLYSLVRFSSTETPIAQAWTLFHEVLFYAVFSLIIVNRPMGIAAFLVWFTLILGHWGYERTFATTFESIVISLFNLNFLFGMCVFAVLEMIPRRAILAILFMGLVAITVVVGLDHAGYRQMFPSFRVSAGMASATVLLGLVSGERAKLLIAPKWLQLLGDASYTIYLTHYALLSAFIKIFLAHNIMHFLDARYSFVLLAISSGAVACLLYVTIERPLLTLLRHRGAIAGMQTHETRQS